MKRCPECRQDYYDETLLYSLDDKEKAFEWLEKAFQYRSFNLLVMKIDPLLDPPHNDPRWADLVQRVGLPE